VNHPASPACGRIPVLFVAALFVSALGFAAPDDPAGPGLNETDTVECPADDSARPASLRSSTFRSGSELDRFAEIDRVARQGCAPKPMLRAWQAARERLAPFTAEPDPARLEVAAEMARRLPQVTGSLGNRKVAPSSVSTWTSIGPANVGGRLKSVVVDPRDENVLYVAAASGGVWKSTDAGGSWRSLTDQADSLSSGSLLLEPGHPDTIYWGTGEGTYNVDQLPGTGVYKSTDAGESWTKAGAIVTKPTRISRVEGLATSPVTILAATENGIYRSTDGAASWGRTLQGEATDVVAEAGSSTNVWVAIGDTYGDAKNGVYRSTDSGATFRKLINAPSGCGRIDLGVSRNAASAGTTYAGCADPSDANFGHSLGVFKTTDFGESWTKLAKAPDYCAHPTAGQCWYDNVVLNDPFADGTVWLGGIDVYRSTDGGGTFAQVSNWAAGDSRLYAHADHHDLVRTPSGVIWSANDGGLARSTDGGATWEDRSRGLVTTQFYAVAQHPTAEAPIIGGFQDNGSIRSLGDPYAWDAVLGGDGAYCAIDPVDPRYAYASIYYLDIRRSQNGGASFPYGGTSGISKSERESRALFIAPFAIDPVRTERLLAGTYRVYLSTNRATGWVVASGDLTLSTSGSISALAFAASDATIAWAGTEAGRLWKSTNIGSVDSWVQVDKSPLPLAGYIKRIAIDPTDANHVWVSYNNSGSSLVFRTTDGGTTWTNVTGSLPSAPTSGIAIDPANPSRVWVGNDVGVFYTENAGLKWFRYGAGLPLARVDELIFHPTLRRLRAATHGRGLFEIDADLVPVEPPVASFSASSTFVSAGQTVRFTDTTTGGTPTSWSWSLGDGSSSTERNPTHVYQDSGTFTVRLTTSNAGGTSSATKSILVGIDVARWNAAVVVPGAARAGGVGSSFFRTALWITNPGSTELRTRLRWIPATGGSSGNAFASRFVNVDPGRVASWNDVASTLFGATADTVGMIAVDVPSGQATPVVTARTYNDAGELGTFGQYIPAVAVRSTAAGTLNLRGLRGDSLARTNVGLVNFSTSEVDVRLTVHDSAGHQLGNEVSARVGAGSMVQVNRPNEVAGAPGIELFSVRIPATTPLFAYASKLDNATSDPIFIPSDLVGRTLQWIDGVASASGLNDTRYRSNLSLANPGSTNVEATISFTPRGGTAPVATTRLTVAPGEELFRSDLLEALFSLTGAGSIRIESTGPLVAWARTFNDLGEGKGGFGQFIPAFGEEDLAGSAGAILPGLSQSATDDSGFRTNLGLVNTGAEAVDATLALFSPTGAKIAETTWRVEAGQALFKSRVLAEIAPGSEVDGGYLVVRPSIPGKLYCWASSIDNVSSDQIFVRPAPIR
jgi:PKD repeat protein